MKNIFLFILATCITTLSFTQKSEEKIIEQQLEDFEIFQTSLFELEANLLDHISLDSLNYFLNELSEGLEKKVWDNKSLYKAYSKILVRIQSGHTNLKPTQDTYKYWIIEKNSLPMDVILVGKKLYTTTDFNLLNDEAMKKLSGSAKKQNTISKYTEITSIDGKSIAQIMEAISPYLSSDYNDINFKYYLAKDLFEFYRNLTVTDSKSKIDVDFLINKKTVTKEIKLGYPPIDDINKRFKENEKEKVKRSERFGTFAIEGGKYAYFRFKTFEKSKGKAYGKFLKESFSKMKDKDLDYLVVDLRDNTGGYVQYEFLSYLFPKSEIDTLGVFDLKKELKPTHKKHLQKNDHYRKFKKLNRKKAKFNKKTGAKYNGVFMWDALGRQKIFGGKIIVITNEATFSAASLLAADLKNLYGAKIIGSPAGGSFHKGATGNLSIELPNSGFVVTFNPVYYKSSYSQYDSQATKPDIEFVPEFKDPKKDEKNNQKNIMKLIKKEFKKRE